MFFFEKEPCSKVGQASFWTKKIVKANLSIYAARTHEQIKLVKENLVVCTGKNLSSRTHEQI